jgi:hypothetical protein
MYETVEEARLAIIEEIAEYLFDAEGAGDDSDISEELRDEIRSDAADIADELASVLNLDVVDVNPETGTVTLTMNLLVTPDQFAQMKADPSMTLDDLPVPTAEEIAAFDSKIGEITGQ